MKSERAMRQHRSFCLPESGQASRQARQEPDGMYGRGERLGGGQRNTGCRSLASPLALGGCVGNVVDDTSGEDEASVKEHKAKPYILSGRSGADAMERKRNGVRTCPAHREWRAALLWPQGLRSVDERASPGQILRNWTEPTGYVAFRNTADIQ